MSTNELGNGYRKQIANRHDKFRERYSDLLTKNGLSSVLRSEALTPLKAVLNTLLPFPSLNKTEDPTPSAKPNKSESKTHQSQQARSYIQSTQLSHNQPASHRHPEPNPPPPPKHINPFHLSPLRPAIHSQAPPFIPISQLAAYLRHLHQPLSFPPPAPRPLNNQPCLPLHATICARKQVWCFHPWGEGLGGTGWCEIPRDRGFAVDEWEIGCLFVGFGII